MLSKVIQILKFRWSEAVMLVGLFAGLSALSARVTQEFTTAGELVKQMPFWSAFLLGMGLMALMILLGTLFLGFLRSIIVEPAAQRHPAQLLRFGRPFFWKLFLFYVLFELVWTVLTALLIAVLHGVLFGQKPVSRIPDWLIRFSQMAALAILIKPFLLMPCILLLKNTTLREAYLEFRSIPFLRMHRLIRTISLGYGLLLATFTVLYVIPFPERFLWLRVGLLNLVSGSVFLFLFVLVLFELGGPVRSDSQEDG